MEKLFNKIIFYQDSLGCGIIYLIANAVFLCRWLSGGEILILAREAGTHGYNSIPLCSMPSVPRFVCLSNLCTSCPASPALQSHKTWKCLQGYLSWVINADCCDECSAAWRPGPALSAAAAASICVRVHLLCQAQAGWEGCNLLQTSWQGSVHSKSTNTDAGTNGVGCLDETVHIWDLFPSLTCLETHHRVLDKQHSGHRFREAGDNDLRTAWMPCLVCAITGTWALCKNLGITFLSFWEKASVNPTLWHRPRLVSHQVCEWDFEVRNSKTLGFHWFVLEGIRKTGFVLVCEAMSLFNTAKVSSQRVIVKHSLESWMPVTALLSSHIWKLHVLPWTKTYPKKTSNVKKFKRHKQKEC